MKTSLSLISLGLVVALLGCETASETPPRASAPERKPIRTLIVGGGSSHDFEKWFNQADTTTLSGEGLATVTYTDKPDMILPALGKLDVLYLCNNQPLSDPALRKGIFDFVEAGHGLVLVHPALWYNWNDWPEYNRRLVSGGARSHDRYGEFDVTVLDLLHPIMSGVQSKFTVNDELYRFERDRLGPPIQVLATGFEKRTGQTYPAVWIVQHPKARIVCCSLGHDGAAHQHPAFQTILRNAVRWAARR